MTTETPFTPDHSDRVTVLQLNHDSSKLLTGSIDHRIAVYDIDPSTGQRKQLDVFTAHDAEIRDAKWFHPSTGTNFVTIGNDLQMRIWTQELSQAPMSGRRFRKIGFIKSEQLVPFVSLDVKTIGMSTYITVVDRQGLLSLYEPSNPDSYKDWTLIDQFYVCTPNPGRSDHTSFRVQFDPNPFPLPYLTSLSDDREQLSIAVAAMNHIKLYRTSSDPDIISNYLSLVSDSPSNNVGRGASHRLFLFQVLTIPAPTLQPLTSAGSLLRDIAYSANNIRGTDVLAVASINGIVAIYEISLQSKSPQTSTTTNTTSAIPSSSTSVSKSANSRQTPYNTHQSNLTSALNPNSAVSASNPSTTGGSTASSSSAAQHTAIGSSNDQQSSSSSSSSSSRSNHPFPYTHQTAPIGILENAHADAWSVQWDPCGQILLSTGSDGTVKLWKRVVGINSVGGSGEFELIAEQGEEDESDSEIGDEGRMEDDGV